MTQARFLLRALGAFPLVAGCESATAADVAAGKALAEGCAGCHGADGVSQMPLTPSLAAQPDEFVQWQLVYFRSGVRMGARSRHQCEFLMTFQKNPKRAKGIWKSHSIRDVWREPIVKEHPHSKPIGLQSALIECLTDPGDVVVDPTAGGFSTMKAAHSVGRRFLGCEYLAENDPALQP